jgi:Leucine-rich repeat (LRR) protein
VCGFGVDLNPNADTGTLDASGCGMEELGELGDWTEEYADLEVLDLSDNVLVELPEWLGQGNMSKLKELRARGNKVEAFVNGMLGGENMTLVDLRDNEIVELPYELMNVTSKNTTLLFDGNPCAAEVDWSGLGVDRLPARMVEEGYNNGGWNSSLRVLKLGRNAFDESVFRELVRAKFTNIEELDVSWNALGGLPVEDLERLRRLDVSGNGGVSVE